MDAEFFTPPFYFSSLFQVGDEKQMEIKFVIYFASLFHFHSPPFYSPSLIELERGRHSRFDYFNRSHILNCVRDAEFSFTPFIPSLLERRTIK